MDVIGTYQKREFTKSRTIDWVDVGRSKRHVPILVELDATAARSYIHSLKGTTGEALSFAGWAIKCIAQAVSEHKHEQWAQETRTKRAATIDHAHDETDVKDFWSI